MDWKENFVWRLTEEVREAPDCHKSEHYILFRISRTEVRAAFWLLGRAYGRSSNLCWVLPSTLLCTCSCQHTHAHTCTKTLSCTYTHSCMYVCTKCFVLVVLTSNRQPAPVAGMYLCMWHQSGGHGVSADWSTLIYAVLRDSSLDSQLKKTNLTMHGSTCTSHWHKTCTLRSDKCYPLSSTIVFLVDFAKTIHMSCVTTAMQQCSLGNKGYCVYITIIIIYGIYMHAYYYFK